MYHPGYAVCEQNEYFVFLITQLFVHFGEKFVDGQCRRRSCDQQVTGRRLRYSRAVEIINDEEYLDEVDLDIIRRSDGVVDDAYFYTDGEGNHILHIL